MLTFLHFLMALLCFMLGAALFSFVNAVAWRLPRGKCRHCGAPIAVRCLLMELCGGAVALACLTRFGAGYTLPAGLFGMSWAALWALVLLGLLAAVALTDGETQTIPDELNLAVAVCGVLAFLLQPQGSAVAWPARIAGALCISVPMLLLCFAVEGAFGGGDIKLMAAAGLCLGWRNTLVAAFLALLAGGGYGIYLLAAKKADRRDHFAFGPFLCAGLALALFFGDKLLQWYLHFCFIL